MPEQPRITANAYIPGSDDLDQGHVSEWCDLVLEVARNDHMRTLELTRSGGEAIIEALHSALHPWAGRSVQEQVWAELDAVTERLLAGEDAQSADGQDQGFARGLATALAIMTNPYHPSLDAVRAMALERQGVARDDEDEDEDVIKLRRMGMIELRTLAERVPIRNYKRMGKDALVAALAEYELDSLLDNDDDDWDEGF